MQQSASPFSKHGLIALILGGLSVLLLCVCTSTAVIMAPLAAFAGGTNITGAGAGTGVGGSTGCATLATPAARATRTACSVVAWAESIATHLSMCGGDATLGTPNFDKCYILPPAPNAMPQPVLAYLTEHYPQDAVSWRSGNFQCVSLVIAAYGLAGLPLPRTSDAVVFWANYRTLPTWRAIPTANSPQPGTPGVAPSLPEPGDLIVWQHVIDAQGDQDAGHIAIVTAVTLPTPGQNGSITFAQANSFAPIASVPLTSELQVLPWPGGSAYTALGYLRPFPPPLPPTGASPSVRPSPTAHAPLIPATLRSHGQPDATKIHPTVYPR